MLCSSNVWAPSAKMIGFDSRLRIVTPVTWKVGAR